MELCKLNCYGFKYFSSVQQKLDEYEANYVLYNKALNNLWNTLTEEEQEGFKNKIYNFMNMQNKFLINIRRLYICLIKFIKIAGKKMLYK